MGKTFLIKISGQVQGVGFRPFVYNLAVAKNIKGHVNNDGEGVVILANGNEMEILNFKAEIIKNAPGAAIVQSSSIEEVALRNFDDFSILPPKKPSVVRTPLTADFPICDNCKTEVTDPDNRRYSYPFTTCTQCGPRYAITRRFPFERHNTSLADFDMCQDCQDEYDNPADRRFHSQTNSCDDCGIRLKLVNNLGSSIDFDSSPVEQLAALLKAGQIAAVKNTSGYLLMADASNAKAVLTLRERKRRPDKPFALLYPDLKSIKEDFDTSLAEQDALSGNIHPIVLLKPKDKTAHKITEPVAPGLQQLGVMLPNSALLLLLTMAFGGPLVATSGNIHGSAVLANEDEVMQELSTVADCFLHHNLEITFPQDDSVWQFAGKQPIVLRRSRGMAPNYLNYHPKGDKRILAMGAHLKSTMAFVPRETTYLSQYFGNLDSFEVVNRFTDSLLKYIQIFDSEPEAIITDKHPGYQSTILGETLAKKWNTSLYQVQHHKAHFAAVLAEHSAFKSTEPILGVVWDGTGLGDDQMIWGGEFFVYQESSIERVNHFEYFDNLAGDKMAREPRISLLSLCPGREEALSNFDATEARVYQKLRQNNNLKTSSIGRLFDALACGLGLIETSSYEGQAAMLLEAEAQKYKEVDYIDLLKDIDYQNPPSAIIVENAIDQIKNGESHAKVAASFIYTLARIIIDEAKKLDISTIACSGGVFQNKFLVELVMEMTASNAITLLLHEELSANDENIALGQLAYYENIKD